MYYGVPYLEAVVALGIGLTAGLSFAFPSPALGFFYGALATVASGLVLATLLPVTGPAMGEWLGRRKWRILLIVFLLGWPLAAGAASQALRDALMWYGLPALLIAVMPDAEAGGPLSPRARGNLQSACRIAAGAVLIIGLDLRESLTVFSVFPEGRYEQAGLYAAAFLLVAVLPAPEGRPTRWRRLIFDTRMWLTLAVTTAGAAVVIVPVGLLTGFIAPGVASLGIGQAVIAFVGILFTIALPEELLFRHLVQADIARRLSNRMAVVVVIALVSVAFGFFHWNNAEGVERTIYVILSTVAGLAYGTAYHFGGLAAALFSHTIVDWLWLMFFSGTG